MHYGGWAALWWRFGLAVGITVILIGANVGLVVTSMNLDRRRRRNRLRADLAYPVIVAGLGEVVVDAAGELDIRSGAGRVDR